MTKVKLRLKPPQKGKQWDYKHREIVKQGNENKEVKPFSSTYKKYDQKKASFQRNRKLSRELTNKRSVAAPKAPKRPEHKKK